METQRSKDISFTFFEDRKCFIFSGFQNLAQCRSHRALSTQILKWRACVELSDKPSILNQTLCYGVLLEKNETNQRSYIAQWDRQAGKEPLQHKVSVSQMLLCPECFGNVRETQLFLGKAVTRGGDASMGRRMDGFSLGIQS